MAKTKPNLDKKASASQGPVVTVGTGADEVKTTPAEKVVEVQKEEKVAAQTAGKRPAPVKYDPSKRDETLPCFKKYPKNPTRICRTCRYHKECKGK